MNKWQQIAYQGLWKNNPAFVQLLGMCPLIAVSNSAINALSLGLATSLIMGITGGVVSLLRFWVPQDMRIPVHVLIVASTTTIIDLLWSALLPGLYKILGLFVPLIVTNCIVLGRVEAFSCKNPPWQAAWDGFIMGLGGTVALFFLGSIREIFGTGTWGSGIELIIPGLHAWRDDWHVLPLSYPGFPMMLMPAGAFVVLALLIVAKNSLDQYFQKRKIIALHEK